MQVSIQNALAALSELGVSLQSSLAHRSSHLFNKRPLTVERIREVVPNASVISTEALAKAAEALNVIVNAVPMGSGLGLFMTEGMTRSTGIGLWTKVGSDSIMHHYASGMSGQEKVYAHYFVQGRATTKFQPDDIGFIDLGESGLEELAEVLTDFLSFVGSIRAHELERFRQVPRSLSYVKGISSEAFVNQFEQGVSRFCRPGFSKGAVDRFFDLLFVKDKVILLSPRELFLLPMAYRLYLSSDYQVSTEICGRIFNYLKWMSELHKAFDERIPYETFIGRNDRYHDHLLSALLPQIPAREGPYLIHQVADSAGSTSADLWEKLSGGRVDCELFSSTPTRDLFFMEDFVFNSKGRVLIRQEEGCFPLQMPAADEALAALALRKTRGEPLPQVYHQPFVDPKLYRYLKSHLEKVFSGESDVMDSSSMLLLTRGRPSDVMTCFNLFDDQRFSVADMRKAVTSMGQALREGGFLMIGRQYTRIEPQSLIVYQRQSGRLVIREDLGGSFSPSEEAVFDDIIL